MINKEETFEEFQIRGALSALEAKLKTSRNLFHVVEIKTRRILGTGANKIEAIHAAELNAQTEALAKDQPTEKQDALDKRCLMTLKEWLDCVKCGGFIDYDGSGCAATETHRGKAVLKPSYAMSGRTLPKWATHVCWYNK